MADDDDEEERDAVQEPHVHHLDVGGDGERAGAVVEESVQHKQCGQAEGEAVLRRGKEGTLLPLNTSTLSLRYEIINNINSNA